MIPLLAGVFLIVENFLYRGSFDELIGAGGISTLTQMTGMFKSMGAILVNGLGPALNVILVLINGLIGALDIALEASGINTLLRVLGGQGLSYDPGKALARMGQGIGMATGSEIATAQGGAITTESGLMNVHANEAVIPISKLADFMADAMAPVIASVDKLNEDFTKKHVPALALSNESGGKKAGREISRQFQMNTGG